MFLNVFILSFHPYLVVDCHRLLRSSALVLLSSASCFFTVVLPRVAKWLPVASRTMCLFMCREFSQLLFRSVEPHTGGTSSKPFTVTRGIPPMPCSYYLSVLEPLAVRRNIGTWGLGQQSHLNHTMWRRHCNTDYCFLLMKTTISHHLDGAFHFTFSLW